MSRLGALRTELRRDEGMTLIEMMVGAAAATVVVMASYAAISAATQMQMRTTDRIDSVERGRGAMETITRDVRAQECVATKTGANSAPAPAMMWASGDGLQFYASVAPQTSATTPGPTAPPQMRRIEWKQTGTSINTQDGTALPVGSIIESTWTPTNPTPPYAFPTKPTAVSTIATELRKIASEPLPADELEKARNFAKGRFVLQLESPQGLIMFGLRKEVLERRLPDPEEVVRGLDAVTSDDVARVASELIGSDRMRLAVIGPFEDASHFERLLDG